MAKSIDRITLFKVAEEDIDEVLAQYKGLKEKALKDDQPYILRAYAQRTYPEARNQGFSICAHTSFASLEDFEYYDKECAVHKALKAVVGPKQSGMMMMYMDATPESRGS
ncbi:hypothetical protein EJ05DRAFT_479909 [Pseudovirgaria hyperparasitica]|uniref:Stress-response A/B barrel domain-containing protein n=1 Tax=Pseudovirgaria hyperparasitica TaxID=470096 RepID=A0A6A6VVR6_9PEZI|nr:uncharacterized protein EJ05DRAFT_479909 [Pseudovirgaria hyperparasitica]KAF2753886.1 hypothetical protein EJ05DRAFT_479909 [Pseudovirgaria hyperparasitica]